MLTSASSFVILVLLALSSATVLPTADRYSPDWASLDARPTPSWFDEAKVGILLHWGVYSVPSYGGEWFWHKWRVGNESKYVEFMRRNYKPGFTYQDFAPQFTAELFDPDRWADVFEKSGARYVVLTSKHLDGFTLWPSNASANWNSQDVGPHRDLVGDLASAVRRKQGMRFGVYHSLSEWFHPLYLADKESNFTRAIFPHAKTFPELRELVERYHPDVLRTDGDLDAPGSAYWNSTSFLAWLFNDSPVRSTVVVNDNWGQDVRCKHGDSFSGCGGESGSLKQRKWEQYVNIDMSAWGYRREASVSDYYTTQQLIDKLVKTISYNGNLLINVGPTKEGTIAPAFEERLLQLGRWLSVNGEAVYGSKPWKHQKDAAAPDVWYTANGNAVYAFVLRWPADEELQLESLNLASEGKITLIGLPGELKWTAVEGKGTTVHFPKLTPGKLLTPGALVLKVEGSL
ncbi:tissue alpha-L-fucosidase [Rhipicephalus sanguineus]|uniref:tissue alpha-L-fucosidase n=1 Tax=Rhipicephalus sanguineus TaxID=34632 RepID=UPI0018949E81|nr:tissue alpha-L-fucosidase [Rhipicephalus sanguineus]